MRKIGNILDYLNDIKQETNPPNPKTRPNPYPPKIINTKPIESNYEKNVLRYDARYVLKQITYYNSNENTFTIENSTLDSTKNYKAGDFEILIRGILIQNDIYKVEQIGQNVIITFQPGYIDYNGLTADDIIIYGKFLEVEVIVIYLETEDFMYLLTEDDNYLII